MSAACAPGPRTASTALASAVSSNPAAGISDLEGSISSGTSSDPSNLNGNNVNLDNETLLGSKTNLAYSLVLRAVDGRFQEMRDALKAT